MLFNIIFLTIVLIIVKLLSIIMDMLYKASVKLEDFISKRTHNKDDYYDFYALKNEFGCNRLLNKDYEEWYNKNCGDNKLWH